MGQKTILWIVGVIVIAIGTYTLIQSNSGAGDMMKDETMQKEKAPEGEMKKDEEVMQKDDAMKKDYSTMKKDEGAMMQKGSYEPYAPEKLAKADTSDVVLFFRASWCPTCKEADANIKANLSAIPSGLTILDIDYDTSTALKQKYGVTYQHTFVQVRSDGSLIKKWSGSPTLAALVSEVQ